MAEISKATHTIRNSAGTQLGLHFFSGAEHLGPIILTHGTFSNHRSCRGLAEHLAKQGFDCWILDMQGHGVSDKPKMEPDFETMALQDTAAVLAFIHNLYPNKKPSWIGHSGGGLSILMYLARHPEANEKIANIVCLASQATDAGLSNINRLKIHIASLFTFILGFAPGKLAKLGPENEFAAVMQQWFGWSLSGQWRGSDDFDYLTALESISIPSLNLAAAGDHFIAPASGCLKLHQAISSKDKTFLLCGRGEGFYENYTHARIISSRNASREIWTFISNWMKSRVDL